VLLIRFFECFEDIGHNLTTQEDSTDSTGTFLSV